MERNTKSASITADEHIFDQWEEEREEMDMSRSEYIRHHVEAGRKQLAELHPSGSDSDNLHEKVTDAVPKESEVESGQAEAPMPDDITEKILEPLRDDIHTAIEELDGAGRIKFKADSTGYVIRDE